MKEKSGNQDVKNKFYEKEEESKHNVYKPERQERTYKVNTNRNTD